MYKKILVHIDGSKTANRALDEGLRLANHHKARLRLIYVVDKLEFAPTVEMADAMADLQKLLRNNGRSIIATASAAAREQGVTAESVMPEVAGGRVAETIVAQAAKWRADLIVIGTHGRRGINRLVMGSDAEQVIRTSPVPVLVIRTATPGR
jgi:nucleotide-binding universal stress UspA family protein